MLWVGSSQTDPTRQVTLSFLSWEVGIEIFVVGLIYFITCFTTSPMPSDLALLLNTLSPSATLIFFQSVLFWLPLSPS